MFLHVTIPYCNVVLTTIPLSFKSFPLTNLAISCRVLILPINFRMPFAFIKAILSLPSIHYIHNNDSKLSEDWESILNSSKSEHLPVGDTSNHVTYAPTSRTSPNTQPVQTVSTVRDMGLLLKTGFSVDDTVARAT